MTTRPRFRTVRPLMLAGALGVAAACGVANDAGDDGGGGTNSDADRAREVRAPVVVEIDPAGPGQATAAPTELLDPAATEGAAAILPWFGGFEYEVGAELPALPDHDIGYQFVVDGDVDEVTVGELADVLGVTRGAVTQRGSGRDGDGVLWRVGPDDGAAPALVVIDDAQLGWYLTGAWADGGLVEPVEGLVEGPRKGQPSGVPSAADAEAAARALLDGLGEDTDALEFETWADAWMVSVTAWEVRDGVRWPLGYGFGFGENGALQWANGWLADPVPAGPYPLIGLDDALVRLAEQQRGWVGVQVEPGVERADEWADEPGESRPEMVVLVDVRADLWWAHDTDGSVWLLPAYAFADAEGRTHTVPAVTDDYLVIDVPDIPDVPELPDTPDVPDVPELPEPVELDGLDRDALVGATVDEATARLEAEGLTLRVARLDGEDLMLTMDYVPTRVNVAVEADVVVELLSVG